MVLVKDVGAGISYVWRNWIRGESRTHVLQSFSLKKSIQKAIEVSKIALVGGSCPACRRRLRLRLRFLHSHPM